MPSIRLKDKTKNRLDESIKAELIKRLDSANNTDNLELIKRIALKKYGITHDEYINYLLDRC